MGWYDNIVKWNDSAGEEAFRNAKARYWAEINGLHCDIPLPDPDMHIDIVDEAPFIDTQLAEDLEDAYKEPSESSPGGSSGVADQPKSLSRVEHGDENVNSLNSCIPIVADKLVPMTGYIDLKDIVPDGWGDDTEAEPQTANGDNNPNSGCAANSISKGKGCDEYVGFVDKSIPVTKHINAWNQNSGWGARIVQDGCDAWNRSSGWDGRVFQGSSVSRRDNSWANQGKYSWRHWKNRNNEPDRSYGRNQNGSRFGSRYPNQRCQGEDRQTYNNWRNCGGKNRIDDDHNRPVQDKPPQATGQWKSKHYFGSMNHQRSGESSHAWQ